MIQLKDYLHYYMGATFWTHNSEGEVNPETLRFIYPMIEKGKCFQLHLRRLEDMTEEEKKQIGRPFEQFIFTSSSRRILCTAKYITL